MFNAREILRARPPDHAADAVALFEEQLGQIGAVLSGYPGDERGSHGSKLYALLAQATSPQRPQGFPCWRCGLVRRRKSAGRRKNRQPARANPFYLDALPLL